MTEEDIKVYWYYFRSLTNQLKRTEQYVDHVADKNGRLLNAKTNSNEFAKILMVAASEFEVVAKALCKEAGEPLRWNANIVSITRQVLDLYPQIVETQISTPYQILKPLCNWHVAKEANRNGTMEDKVMGIPWWYDHNSIKHNRDYSFHKANLENCINSTAALMVLELYLSQTAIGNVDAITSLGCDYYDCDYGLTYLEADIGYRLPDYR